MHQMLRKPADDLEDGEPAWDVAYLFPPQGQWTESDYLALDTNHMVELVDGFLEVLPMPTTTHQLLIGCLYRLLWAFCAASDLGTAALAGIRVRLRPRTFREPDVVFMLKEHADRIGEEYWKGADLVMEVVSKGPENRERDLVKTRLRAGKNSRILDCRSRGKAHHGAASQRQALRHAR